MALFLKGKIILVGDSNIERQLNLRERNAKQVNSLRGKQRYRL